VVPVTASRSSRPPGAVAGPAGAGWCVNPAAVMAGILGGERVRETLAGRRL